MLSLHAKVVIIIVNWNGKADTLACIHSLHTDRHQLKHIIVVDNGSTDGSIAAIAAEAPDVTIIDAGRNLGFTGGNNIGVRRAAEEGADFVLLLNNDTTVEPDAISSLVEAAQRSPNAGILTPVIHYFDRMEDLWFAGSRIDLARAEAVHDNSRPPARTAPVRLVPWASGCAMMIPAQLFRQIKGFDDRFFLNWEDVDISLRIRSAGKDILLVPAARIYHKVGRSFATARGAGTYYYARNRLLLLRLHAGAAYISGYRHAVVDSLRLAVRGMLRQESGSLRGLVLLLRAILDDLLGRFGSIRNL